MKLTVKSALEGDVFKDIVRIHQENRGPIKAGRVCKISVKNGKEKFFIVRGLPVNQNSKILMDDISREALGVELGEEYEFEVKEAGLWGKVWWACTVADTAPRIAAQLGVLSVILGALGVILGAISLF